MIHRMRRTGIMEPSMEHMFSVEAMVCGHHKYQNAWNAPIGEILVTKKGG